MIEIKAWGIVRPTVWWLEQSYCAVSYATLARRIKQGWDAEKAIITPPIRKKRRDPEVGVCLDCDDCRQLLACHNAKRVIKGGLT